MRASRSWWAWPAVASLVLPTPSRSQRTQQISGMDADVEGVVTGVSLTVLPQLETLSGEAYQWLEGRWRGALDATVSFKGGYALGLEVGRARLAEELESGHAWATDVVLELLWERSVGRLRLTAGPVGGYGRVSRPAYGEATHGFVGGGEAAAAWPVLGSLEMTLDVSGLWSSFTTLSRAAKTPAGFEDDAVGQRLLVGLGVGYRWGSGSAVPDG